MAYLISQILLCLVAAALIGLLIGWLWGRLGLDRWRGAYEELELDHNARRADLEDMRSSLAARTSGLEHATADLDKAKERIGLLETDLEKRGASLATLQTNIKEQESELVKLRPLGAELETRDKRIGELETRLSTLGSEKDAELSKLRAELDKRPDEARLLELQSQITTLQNDVQSRATALEEAQGEAATFKTQVSEKDGRIAELEAQMGDAQSHATNVETLTNQLANLQRNYSVQLERVAELETELSAAQGEGGAGAELEAQVKSLQGDIEARDVRVKDLEAQLNLAQTASQADEGRDFKARVSSLESDLAARNQRITELEGELSESRANTGDVASLTSQLSTLRTDLDARSSRVSALESQLNDPDRALGLVSSRYTVQRPNLRMRFLGKRVRLRGYVPQDAQDDVVAQAEKALGEGSVINELRSDDVVSVPTWMPDTLRVTPEVAQDLQTGSIRVSAEGVVLKGLVGESAQRERIETAVRKRLGDELSIDNQIKVVGSDIEADDLKDIKGIETVLEPIMHAIGVYTFRQIANWDADDIEQVKDALQQFKTRIEREDWIGQARELHKEKYGEEPSEI